MKNSEKKAKKDAFWISFLMMVPYLIIGMICGSAMEKIVEAVDNFFLVMLYMFACILVSIYLQIILHESGHLIFGRASGYKFSSFRIGSLALLKIDGKYVFKRYTVAGTGGQCLMLPPDTADGKIPYVMYNLGGSIVNAASSLAFGTLAFIFRNNIWLFPWLLTSALVGIVFALTNGVPMRTVTVDNDGYNAKSLGKNPRALRAFYIQMMANDMQMRGIRLRDMPEEFFAFPSDEDMKNSMCATLAVFACNRLMDEGRFDEAYDMIVRTLSPGNAVVPIHRTLLKLDLTFCALITDKEENREFTELTKDDKNVVKAMKGAPCVIRTQYATELLRDKDSVKAEKTKKFFNKMVKKYPYEADAESEMELVELVERKSSEQ